MDEPEEDYWGASNVKSSHKKLNIFDDSVTVEAASDLALFKKSLQEEDIETVGWDDRPVTKPQAGDASLPRPTFDPYYSSTPPASSSSSSYQTHSRSRSDVPVSGMGKMSLTKSPSTPQDTFSPRIDSEPSISTMLGLSDSVPAAAVKKTYSAQEQEVLYLKRQLHEAQRGLTSAGVKVEDTIKRMLLGQPYQLEQYKSMEDKLKLLDKAIATHDGNCIITAVVFLKRTLADQLFNLEMMRRPVAVDQYLAYLKAHFNHQERERMLVLLGRSEEVAMLKFKQIVAVDDPFAKIDRLNNVLRAHFEASAALQHDASLIQQQINILRRQSPVDVGDEMAQKEGRHVVFRAMPRKASILHQPVITTLYYCCMYHYEEPETQHGSPLAIKKEHQLTEKQYVWTAVKARAKLEKWGDVEALFTTKGWLGGTKMKAVIGFDKVAGVLHKFEAPHDVIGKYLNLIDDVEKRMALATKMECHDVVVDAFRAQKDRRGLELYQMKKMKPNSREWFYAKDVLNNNQIKWKA